MWFISSSETEKDKNIEKDKRVTVTFQNNSKNEHLVLWGNATLHKDKALIEKYWTFAAVTGADVDDGGIEGSLNL